MRHIILSILLFLSSATTLVADDNPVLDLMLIDHCFLLDDTATLNKLYRDLEPRIAKSSRWQDKFYYYKLRADYYFDYEEFVNQAIADYKTALSAFPNDAFPNLDYMETNYELCELLDQTKQYDEGEKYASHALVRGMAQVDSCYASSLMFSLLAKFYEEKGDTIMPNHFHQKAQELGIKYNILTSMPDSIEIYNQRLLEKYQLLNHSKDSISYLSNLSNYLVWVSNSGNINETIWTGERILQLTQRYGQTQSVCSYVTYYYLLHNYALKGDLEKLEELYPKAKAYYSLFPEEIMTVSLLSADIANALMENYHYKEALPYLRSAKANIRKDKDDYLIPKINEMINECKRAL